MPLVQGQVLNNRYRIVKKLGEGGFGAVYRAWDINLKRPCALKENLEIAPQAQRQFLREAVLLANLSHPGLPRVTDHFVLTDQGQYLVMDYVEGQDLEEMRHLVGGILPEAQVISWIIQICDALAYLHNRQSPIIHRDIKPANIKIAPQGKAMLVDFGIAKVYDPQAKTTGAARAVTPGYSPFEQYGQTTAATDARSDIYALGATLYTLLTGVEPPESPARVFDDPLKPPRLLNPRVSPQAEAVILRAMQMDPARRFQGAGEFKAVLTPLTGAWPEKKRDTWQPAVTQPSPPASSTLPVGAGGSSAIPSPIRKIGDWFAVGWALLGVVSLVLLIFIGIKVTQTYAQHTAESSTRAAEVTQTYAVAIPSFIAQATQTAQAFLLPTPTPPTILSATPTPSLLPYTPTPGVGSPTLSTIDEMQMIYIPAGTFQMGENADQALAECRLLYEPFATQSCDRSWFEDEEPVHSVRLDAFYIDMYEVTNGQYVQCVAVGACSPPSRSSSYSRALYYGNSQYNNYPVIYVSWYDAERYCAWIGRRLPTEAEWEYAARGGLTSMRYPWGDSFDSSMANFCDVNCPESFSNSNFDDGYTDIAPVGSYQANGYGLYDMAGNVWEWVADWYDDDYFSSSPSENPSGPASGVYRVLRGGGWYSSGNYLLVSDRERDFPDGSFNGVGFRCALSP